MLVVEHNAEVIKTADWIIDLGPEGGAGGGRIIAAGTPEQVAETADSFTGQVLKRWLGTRGRARRISDRSDRSVAMNGQGGLQERPRAELAKAIKVRGARQHNLKGIDVEIPRDQMTVCCGPSGSGKTSLAMDTIYAEGQRRYVESLSSYARQFVDKMQKPRLDHIEGLSPAIAIEQKHAGHSPRSTVGTVTEIYDYLRILVSRLGQPHCPGCDLPVGTQTADEIIDKIMQRPAGTRLYLMAPLEIEVGEKYEALWEEMRAAGYVRVRIDGQTHTLDQPPQIDRRRKHRVEVVIDRVTVRPDGRSRIAGSVENALAKGRGVLHVTEPRDDVPEPDWPVEIHSQHFACQKCGRSFETLSPHNFSFNSPLGWCPACEGLGVQTGTNPAALLRDPKLSLAQGAVALWPGASNRLFALMLESFSRGTGIPIDVPYDQLGGKHRRLIMHGTGEQWFDVGDALRGVPGRRNGTEPVALRSRPAGVPHCFPLPVQRPLPGPGRSQPRFPRFPRPPGTPRRRGRLHGLRRQPLARRRCGRAFPRPHDRRDLPPTAGQDARRLPRLEADGHRAEDRRRSLPRDLQSHAVPGRRGARLPHARPAGPHAFRRRNAAHPPGRAGGQRAVRRALRARRADDRPAPPRQRPAAWTP